MKLNKLLTARAVISKCAGDRLPAPIAYKFARFLRLTEGDEVFYNDKFRAILNVHAKKDEAGNFVKAEGNSNGIALNPDTAKVCQQEIKELENTEIELPFHFTMGDMGGLTLTIKDCLDLDDLIKEGE